MLILIDRDELKMVAAAANRRWINLVGYCDFPGKQLIVVDSLDGDGWTVMGRDEMSKLFTNMSGQPAPEYGEAIKQLRAYSDTWPSYPKSESQLEKEAEAIYQEERSDEAEAASIGGTHFTAHNEISRETHQACIEMAETANEKLSPAERAETQQNAANQAAEPKPKKAPSEQAERPRQGVTKRIWEIADELLSVTGSIGSLKEFRKQVIARASAEGANEGTAATQFGKWKTSKGL